MKKTLTDIIKFVVFLSIGSGILYMMYTKNNAAYQEDCQLKGIPLEECSLLDKIISDFASTDYSWILLVLLAFTMSNLSRAIRWNMLLKPLGYQPRTINSFGAISIAYFANLAIPRMGEVVRAGVISRYEKIPVATAMGTIVTDRIIDVISILSVTALAFILEFDVIYTFFEQHAVIGDKVDLLVQLGVFMVIFGILTITAFFMLRKRLEKYPLYIKITGILAKFWEGIQSIRQLDKPWLFILHSINIWFMYFLMTYFCFFAFAPTAHLSPLAALVVFIAGGWGIVVPSPGGMGAYHFLAQTALSMYGIPVGDGFSWANIAFFSINLGNNVLYGILALLLLPILNKNYHGKVNS